MDNPTYNPRSGKTHHDAMEFYWRIMGVMGVQDELYADFWWLKNTPFYQRWIEKLVSKIRREYEYTW